jgi:hypothetical protein
MKSDMSNLKTMITRTKSIISYEILCLWENFQGTCFRNAFFKTCQHATMDEKVYKGLNMYLSRLRKGICKSVSLGPKNQEIEDKNGIRHVRIQIYPQGN